MDTPETEFAASKVKKAQGDGPAAGSSDVAVIKPTPLCQAVPAISVPAVFLDAFSTKSDPDDIVGNPSKIHPELANPKIGPGTIVTVGEHYPTKLTPEEESISAARIAASKESREKFLAYLAGASIDLKKELRDLFVASIKRHLAAIELRNRKPWYARILMTLQGLWNALCRKSKGAIEAARMRKVFDAEARKTKALRALVLDVSKEFTVESVNEFTMTMAQVLEDVKNGKVASLPGETEKDAARRIIVERAKAFE